MKIETGVQIPPQPKSHIEVIKAMKPGDSVFCAGDKSSNECPFYSSAKVYASGKDDVAFRARQVEGGVRVWRTT